MLHVHCGFSAPIGRFDYSDFVRALDLNVWAYDEEGRPVVLGRYSADHLLVADAELEDWDLFDVCDQDSQGLLALYGALFGVEDNEPQPELAVSCPVAHVLFLWRSVLHPKIRPYEAAILQTIGDLFGCETLLAMWREVSELTDAELDEAGFAKIAGTRLVFRHVGDRTKYSDAHPGGEDVAVEFEADAADQRWVDRRWHRKGARIWTAFQD